MYLTSVILPLFASITSVFFGRKIDINYWYLIDISNYLYCDIIYISYVIGSTILMCFTHENAFHKIMVAQAKFNEEQRRRCLIDLVGIKGQHRVNKRGHHSIRKGYYVIDRRGEVAFAAVKELKRKNSHGFFTWFSNNGNYVPAIFYTEDKISDRTSINVNVVRSKYDTISADNTMLTNDRPIKPYYTGILKPHMYMPVKIIN